MARNFRVGVDIGGTFTDIIFIGDDGTTFIKKVLSTPDDYARAIIAAIQEVIADHGLSASDIEEVVHGSTIVTNACIELTGAKIGVITTKGFRDVLEIGRGRMPVMYDLTWSKPPPLAPRYLRLEVDERINAKGEIIRPLDIEGAKAAIDKLVSLGVQSIAVCLFNSPKNPVHEQKIGELLKERAPQIYVSLSTEVMPLIKEYERTSETAVNAYVMPLVATYLRALRQELTEAGVAAPLYVMQSSGGMIAPEAAAERPVEIIECGLQVNGFEVTDIGVDVDPERFVEVVRDNNVQILGLSALLTSTMPMMEATIKALEKAGLRQKVKVMVGGASVTQAYADRIGADGYGADAVAAVEKARALISTQPH